MENKCEDEEVDKVNPIVNSRRSESSHFGMVLSHKSRKNTNQTEDLRNILSGQIMNSNMVSAASGHSSNDRSQMRRSITFNESNPVS